MVGRSNRHGQLDYLPDERQLGIELQRTYESGLRRQEATANAVLFGIQYADDIRRIMHRRDRSRTAVIEDIIAISSIGRDVEPMISLGVNLSGSVDIRRIK